MSVKEKLDKFINHITANGHTPATSDLLATLTLAKQRIETLEERIAGTLTARDKVALELMPFAAQHAAFSMSEADAGTVLGYAFVMADMFFEAGKEVKS